MFTIQPLSLRTAAPFQKDRPMSKIALSLTFRAQPGQRDALATHLAAAGATYQSEAGTEAFVVHTSPTEPDVVHVYERYASAEAQRLHEATPEYAATRARTAEFLAGPPLVVPLRVVGGKL